MKFTEIDKIFDSFLLCDINILENENIIKAGKLKMVQLKNNILKFYLDINGVLKIFEYFYPFDLKVDDNKIIFNYDINKVIKGNKKLKSYFQSYSEEEVSPLLNKKITFIKK